MKTKKYALAVMGVAAAVFALPAAAQMRTPSLSSAYIGGGIGQSKAKDGCTGIGGTGVSCDDKDTAWRIFAGYQFHRNVAAELGYTDLGKVSASGTGIGNAEIKSTAWDLSAILAWPVANQFSVFGRLGFYNAEAKLSGSLGQSGKKTTTDLTYGLGVQYDFTRNFGVRGEWQRYSKVKAHNNTTGADGESDIDVLGVSLVYRFQ
jgi:OOP family OmpA-OmpF porin